MPNILITGGCGFIGSHLAERCLAEGWRVSVIDDLSTGSEDNIALLRGHPRFTCTFGTVLDVGALRPLVLASDVVFHLASAVGVKLIIRSPVSSIRSIVCGTETLLRVLAEHPRPTILASSSEVYGKSPRCPLREDDDLVLGPTTIARWSYACGKAVDECLGLSYWREFRVPVTITRLFNTVGPRQTARYGMVLPAFVNSALANDPITVFGNGRQARCFSFVGDVVEALIRLALAPYAAGEVVNVGNDEEMSILELARLVKAMAGSESRITLVPYEAAYGSGFEDLTRRVPDLAKLVRLIGYRPNTPVDRIISPLLDAAGHPGFSPGLRAQTVSHRSAN